MPAIIRFLGYDPLSPTDSFSERLASARRATAMPDFSRPKCKRQYCPTAGELRRNGLVAPHRVCHDIRLVTGAFSIDPDSQFAEAKPTYRYTSRVAELFSDLAPNEVRWASRAALSCRS
jgi:hypothetical protein